MLARRYRLLAPIGRGGFADVWRAEDLRDSREVAVKVLRADTPSPEMSSRIRYFRREMDTVGRLRHSNVVAVSDSGVDGATNEMFIVMELMREGCLADLIKEGNPSLDEAVDLLCDAARGVAAGHELTMVHRDIKPANVLLTREGERRVAKVGDWGIVKILETVGDATHTVNAPFSPPYAAPEQHRGERPTLALDVFALGLLGFELLTGRRPLSTDGLKAFAMSAGAAIQGPRAFDGRIPIEVDEVIRRALEARPSARYPNASAFLHALEGGWQRARGYDIRWIADRLRERGHSVIRSSNPREALSLKFRGTKAIVVVGPSAGSVSFLARRSLEERLRAPVLGGTRRRRLREARAVLRNLRVATILRPGTRSDPAITVGATIDLPVFREDFEEFCRTWEADLALLTEALP
jgi:serine/threonine protein kinase